MHTNNNANLSPFDEAIIAQIKLITNPKTGLFNKVYPADVVRYVPCKRSVRQLRRDMNRLAELKYLERLGPRKGYQIPQYLQ